MKTLRKTAVGTTPSLISKKKTITFNNSKAEKSETQFIQKTYGSRRKLGGSDLTQLLDIVQASSS